jgi:putative ABC transport system permease protein
VKYFGLIWGGLWRKSVRTLFTLLSIVVAFLLFGTLQGIDTSFKQLVDKGRLNVLVTTNPASLPLPLADLQQIQAVKGVKAVTYWSIAITSYQTPGNIVPILVVDPDKFFQVYDPVIVASAKDVAALRNNRTGALVTAGMAQRNHWKIGDRVPVKALNAPKKDGTSDWTFDIVGFFSIPDQGDRNIMLAGYPYFDTARSKDPGTVDRYVMNISDASQGPVIANAIDNLFVNSPARTHTETERANSQSQLAQLGDLDFFVDAIVAAAFATLLLLTGTTLMQSYRERTSELAVMKTLGFTDGGTAALLLIESVLLCVGAALVGLGVANVLLNVVGRLLQGALPAMHLPTITFLAGLAAALALALISALIPAWNARRLSIVDALAGR